VLERAFECAELTVPSLLPREGQKDFRKTYQSVGARGVNHLAGKLMMAMFPPGTSFFKLELDDFIVDELAARLSDEQELTDARGEFETALSRVERALLLRMEQRSWRSTLFESSRHLIVAGNVLLQMLDDGGIIMHPLTRYVVKRDKAGNVLEIVLKESVARGTLPDTVRRVIAQSPASDEVGKTPEEIEAMPVDIYTRITRRGKTWRVYQEVRGQMIPETQGSYPLDKCPWQAIRFGQVDGEDYGRAMVYDYIGDLSSLESLEQSLVCFAAAAAKIIFLYTEGGETDPAALVEATSGDFVRGNRKDVDVFQLDKFHDFQVAKSEKDDIQRRLEQAFLLMSGAQRNAERVTAEEIRKVVQELEQALGGTYALLAQELQGPLVQRLIHQMTRERALPALPDEAVSPKIITGVDAFGRTNDLMRLDAFLGGVVQLFPDAVAEYVNVGSYMTRRAAALGIDLKGLIRSEDEVQAAREAAAQQSINEKIAPTVAQAAADSTQPEE
jgi:hypothetical protein